MRETIFYLPKAANIPMKTVVHPFLTVYGTVCNVFQWEPDGHSEIENESLCSCYADKMRQTWSSCYRIQENQDVPISPLEAWHCTTDCTTLYHKDTGYVALLDTSVMHLPSTNYVCICCIGTCFCDKNIGTYIDWFLVYVKKILCNIRTKQCMM